LKPENAIHCHSQFGPYFGHAGELAAYKEPFNAVLNCKSVGGYSVYGIELEKQQLNKLT
jgi:hypothetical protein